MLIKDYYQIDGATQQEGTHHFQIRLNTACNVYEGHFPGEPVSPGVCNIQMLKELAESIVGHSLVITNLALCRLTTLVTPQRHPVMEANVSIEPKGEAYKMQATLTAGDDTCMELKADLKASEA